MTKGRKIGLIVSLLVVAAVAIVAGMIRLSTVALDGQREGRVYGQTHAKKECVDTDLEHAESCSILDVGCEMQANMSLMAWMQTRKTTERAGTCRAHSTWSPLRFGWPRSARSADTDRRRRVGR